MREQIRVVDETGLIEKIDILIKKRNTGVGIFN